MGGNHPLAQLVKLRVFEQRLAELRLAQQQGLEQRMRAELEVREHAQLLERADRQVLRFIDDQQAAPTGACLVVEEALDRAERGGLVMPLDHQAEGLGDDMDHFLAIKPAGDDLRGGEPGRVNRCHEVRDER